MNAKQMVVSASLVMVAMGRQAAFAGADPSAQQSDPTGNGTAANRARSVPGATPSAGGATEKAPAKAAKRAAEKAPKRAAEKAPAKVPKRAAEEAPAKVPKRAAAKKAPPCGSLGIGAGYGPDDGFIATAALKACLGGGRALSLRADISQRRRRFQLQFAAPHFDHTDLDLHIEIHDRQRSWPGANATAVGGAVTLARPVGAHTHAFVSYRLDQLSFEPARPRAARALTPESPIESPLVTRSLLSSLRAGIDYDSRDNPLDPERGTSAGLWIEGAAPALGSDTRMLRAHAWFERHQPLGPLTLHLGLRASLATSPDPGGVPLAARLRLDGASELPGYAPASLGPRDPLTGLPLGGNVKVSGHAALELPLIARIGLSGEVFADAAGVFDLEPRGPGGVGASAGAGLVWHSPIGPIHADVAFPIDGGPPEFIIGLGIPF